MIRNRSIAASLLGGIALAGVATSAFANDMGTVSGGQHVVNGVSSSGCTSTMSAESVDSTDASLYPANLLVGRDGQPVPGGAAGGNGGYVTEVGDTIDNTAQGMFEVNHFSAGAHDIQIRIPLATKYAQDDITMVVQLAKIPSGATWTTTPASNTAVPSARWGAEYGNYAWSNLPDGATVALDGTTATVHIPHLDAGTGTVVQFSANDAVASDRDDNLLDYRASVTGTYTGCTAPDATTRTVVTDPGSPAVYKTVTTPGKPAVYKTVTTPGKPAVYRTSVPVVRATVQMDQYLDHWKAGSTVNGHVIKHEVKMTAAQLKQRDAARAADRGAGKLVYRKGSAATWLWGSTNATVAPINLCSTSSMPSNTDIWVLDTAHGATAKLPWGKGGKLVQTLPKASACAPVKTLVTPAVPAKTTKVLVTPATAPTTTQVLVTPAVAPTTTQVTRYTCGDVVTTKDTGCVPVAGDSSTTSGS